jgi:putative hydrolase of the HAD superfamily
VAQLARDYALGLISNNALPGDHHARVLRRAGILEYIDCAVWSANFGRRKPDPAMILYVLAELGIARQHAIFVGDKLRTDVAAARAAGVRSVYIRKRGSPYASAKDRPDFTIGDLRALPGLLRQLG